MSTLRLRKRMEIIGANPYVMVSARKASQFKRNWRGPMPVRFRVKGGSTRTWRINLMPVGDGRFRLYLNGNIRKESNLRVGDTVLIEVQFDELYRNGPLHPMPVWFADELSRNPLATREWDQLAPSRQKEILRYFAQLKSPEAMRRNAQRAVYVLAGGSGRFMARTWNEKNHTPSSERTFNGKLRRHREVQ
jgi:Domain of unknown function (DUF1905)/Bacteriocin-protection, YdeI or OmpD-Associated